MNKLDMDNSDKIIEGLERAYKKLIEFKKYKKTPIIVSKDGKVVEIYPDKITTKNNVYTK
jgi:sulfur carrier protein ThiS